MKSPALAVFAALSLALSACAGMQVPREELSDPGALLFNGYTRPEVTCYRCHNGTALGSGKGPSLARRVPKHTAQEIFDTVRQGDKKMPKFSPKKISDEELHQVIAWLQATFPAAPAAE